CSPDGSGSWPLVMTASRASWSGPCSESFCLHIDRSRDLGRLPYRCAGRPSDRSVRVAAVGVELFLPWSYWRRHHSDRRLLHQPANETTAAREDTGAGEG